MAISKSEYTSGSKCDRAVWVSQNEEELVETQTGAPISQESIKQVKETASSMHAQGSKSASNGSMSERISKTSKLLKMGEENIHGASFESEGVQVNVDVLKKTEKGWEAYGIKTSTSDPEKGLKGEYDEEAGLIKHILAENGIELSSVNIMTLNKNYVQGKELDLDELFITTDVTAEAETEAALVPQKIAKVKAAIEQNAKPAMSIGSQCDTCSAKKECWNELPPYFEILNKKKSVELMERGIKTVEDIPMDALTEKEQFIIQKIVANETVVDKEKITEFLDTIKGDIYHFDFETYQSPIPEFEGAKPFQQMPFQYSLHIDKGGKMEHKEFLAKEGEDPREAIIKRMIEDIPKDGLMTAFNASFEKGRIKELAEAFPEYKDHLMSIHDNVVDLADPFKNRDFYHPDMKNGYSIKKVMPIMVPEMEDAYKKLDINNGSKAMTAFANLPHVESKEEREKIREDLLKYCELDTLSMVEIHKALKETVDYPTQEAEQSKKRKKSKTKSKSQ